jgi:hypothetical protein
LPRAHATSCGIATTLLLGLAEIERLSDTGDTAAEEAFWTHDASFHNPSANSCYVWLSRHGDAHVGLGGRRVP